MVCPCFFPAALRIPFPSPGSLSLISLSFQGFYFWAACSFCSAGSLRAYVLLTPERSHRITVTASFIKFLDAGGPAKPAAGLEGGEEI